MVSLHILHFLSSGLIMLAYVVGSDVQLFLQLVSKLLKNEFELFGLHWLQLEIPPLHTIQF